MGTAHYFNGSNAYVYIPDSPSLRVNDFTIIIWNYRITANPSHYEYIIQKNSDVWYGSISITDETGGTTAFRIEAPQGTENGFYVSNFWDIGKWTMGAFVRSGSNAYIYKNGTLVASTSGWNTSSIYYTTSSWGIPLYLGGIQRYISNVYIYNRALSSTEIQQIYNTPNNPPTNGLVLWFGNPDFTNDCCKAIWRDKSGNGNNGQLYNVQMAYY